MIINIYKNIRYLIIIILLLFSCKSVVKQFYEDSTARFNSYFIANENIKKVQNIIYDAYKWNYDEIIPIISPLDSNNISQYSDLTNNAIEYYPSMNVSSIGYGAGQKDFDAFSNVLKIIQGDENNSEMDSIKILETNIDDISGEILGYLIEKIMEQGAKDVSIYPGITKKGRPTNLVCVICDDVKVDVIIDTLVLETGTLGVRISNSNRHIVPRTNHNFSLTFDDKSFEINYKKSSHKGKIHFKIEFEDLKNISNALDKPIVDIESFLRREIEKRENL